MLQIEEIVRQTIQRHGMLSPGERVLVACSGGPDSVALLHVLHRVAPQLKLRLRVAHLNHGLRGRAADTDAQSVQRLAAKLRLPCTVQRIRIARRRGERPPGLEQAARDARYRALIQITKRHRCQKIAMGHTQDDQAETVLMWLLRGAGTHGLAGMPAARDLAPGIRLIRPLIAVSRRQVLHYLQTHRLASRLDRSNGDLRRLRNRIRRHLLPLLERRYNPAIRRVLARTAEVLADDQAFIEAQAAQLFKRYARCAPQAIRFERQAFRWWPPALQKAITRLALARLNGGLRRIEHRHWELIRELIEGATPSAHTVQLPHGGVVASEGAKFLIRA